MVLAHNQVYETYVAQCNKTEEIKTLGGVMNTYDAAANTICPNPFEAFAAAALKAMGITKPHEELMARKGWSPDVYGKCTMKKVAVRLVEKTTKHGIGYREYVKAERCVG